MITDDVTQLIIYDVGGTLGAELYTPTTK